MVIERFNVFLVRLDPATGAETAKTRPCVIVSPNELNRAIATVIIRTDDNSSPWLADPNRSDIPRQVWRDCTGSNSRRGQIPSRKTPG